MIAYRVDTAFDVYLQRAISAKHLADSTKKSSVHHNQQQGKQQLIWNAERYLMEFITSGFKQENRSLMERW